MPAGPAPTTRSFVLDGKDIVIFDCQGVDDGPGIYMQKSVQIARFWRPDI